MRGRAIVCCPHSLLFSWVFNEGTRELQVGHETRGTTTTVASRGHHDDRRPPPRPPPRPTTSQRCAAARSVLASTPRPMPLPGLKGRHIPFLFHFPLVTQPPRPRATINTTRRPSTSTCYTTEPAGSSEWRLFTSYTTPRTTRWLTRPRRPLFSVMMRHFTASLGLCGK